MKRTLLVNRELLLRHSAENFRGRTYVNHRIDFFAFSQSFKQPFSSIDVDVKGLNRGNKALGGITLSSKMKDVVRSACLHGVLKRDIVA
jgi:hypothetical protein